MLLSKHFAAHDHINIWRLPLLDHFIKHENKATQSKLHILVKITVLDTTIFHSRGGDYVIKENFHAWDLSLQESYKCYQCLMYSGGLQNCQMLIFWSSIELHYKIKTNLQRLERYSWVINYNHSERRVSVCTICHYNVILTWYDIVFTVTFSTVTQANIRILPTDFHTAGKEFKSIAAWKVCSEKWLAVM